MFIRIWIHKKSLKINSSWQKELDTDPKTIEQIEFVGKFKNVDGINDDGTEYMFVSTMLEKIRETSLKFSQGSLTVL